MRMKLGILLILTFLSSGCVSTDYYRNYNKNYKLNEVKTARLGEPIAKVNDEYCSKQTTRFAIPSDDFTLEATYIRYGIMQENIKVKLYRNMKYPIADTVKHNGVDYNVVFIRSENWQSNFGVLIDKQGIISSTDCYLTSIGIMPVINLKFSPEKSLLTVSSSTSCNNVYSGDINYDLIYTGMDDANMYITYREFPRYNNTVPTYFKNFIYKTTERQIHLNDFVIDILEADKEKLKYKITEDKLNDEWRPALIVSDVKQ